MFNFFNNKTSNKIDYFDFVNKHEVNDDILLYLKENLNNFKYVIYKITIVNDLDNFYSECEINKHDIKIREICKDFSLRFIDFPKDMTEVLKGDYSIDDILYNLIIYDNYTKTVVYEKILSTILNILFKYFEDEIKIILEYDSDYLIKQLSNNINLLLDNKTIFKLLYFIKDNRDFKYLMIIQEIFHKNNIQLSENKNIDFLDSFLIELIILKDLI